MPVKRGGFVAIAGRPNTGKSTLLNRMVNDKVSIVSARQQTTRHVVPAVIEAGDTQIAWLDTPGWQKRHAGQFNRLLNRSAEWAVEQANLILFIVTPRWTAEDEVWLARLPGDKAVIGVINKIDLRANKNTLLPAIGQLSQRRDFAAIVPLSAKTGDGVDSLLTEIVRHLPDNPPPYPAAPPKTELSLWLAELLREKLFRLLGDELPHRIGVTAEIAEESPKWLKAALTVHVEKESQKRIVIGAAGGLLKAAISATRLEVERRRGGKVFLSVHVRVTAWRQNPALLNQMRIGRMGDGH